MFRISSLLVVFAALWPVSVRLSDVSIVDYVWGPGFALQVGAALIVAGQAGGRRTETESTSSVMRLSATSRVDAVSEELLQQLDHLLRHRVVGVLLGPRLAVLCDEDQHGVRLVLRLGEHSKVHAIQNPF